MTATAAVSRAAAAAMGGREAFVHELFRVGGARVTGGNSVRMLRDGPAVFGVMLQLIRQAQVAVGLESYIFRADDVGVLLANELVAAARRGVTVRLIYDWVGSRGTPRSFRRALRNAGVQVAVFGRPSLRRRWLGLVPRDHRKLLVVDGAVGVIGGVGIGHEWMRGARPGGERWRDTAVVIRGPAARDMVTAFERVWERTVGASSLDGEPFAAPPTLPNDSVVVGIVEGEPGRLRVARMLHVQAALARERIWIADAYFSPSFGELEALTGAARDGVDVRLLVPGRTDHNWVTSITRRYYRRLFDSGVRVWEWNGEMMHAKTSVIDGRYTRVGSTDFNPLGVAINLELDALIDDPCVGAEADSMFLEDLAMAREVGSRVSAVVGSRLSALGFQR
jgi:cardiolipin synthase